MYKKKKLALAKRKKRHDRLKARLRALKAKSANR